MALYAEQGPEVARTPDDVPTADSAADSDPEIAAIYSWLYASNAGPEPPALQKALDELLACAEAAEPPEVARTRLSIVSDPDKLIAYIQASRLPAAAVASAVTDDPAPASPPANPPQKGPSKITRVLRSI